MTFTAMLTDFQNILDRSDCSTAQATTFLQQAMSRIQRDCRLPSMERALLITATLEPMLFFPVPQDLIQPIDILVPDGCGGSRPLERLSYRQLIGRSTLHQPHAYARYQGVIQLRGGLPVGSQLQFLYYGNFSTFANADADNELSASTPDLAVYGALSYAGDTFQHPSAALWEGRYQAIKDEVMAMAVDLDAEGGPQAMQLPFNWDV